MKKVFCVLCLLLSIQLFSSEAFAHNRMSWGKDNRSASLPLSGAIEGDLLWLNFQVPLENVTICLYDENGQQVYNEDIQVCSPQSYCLPLNDFLPGMYILEINGQKVAEIFCETESK